MSIRFARMDAEVFTQHKSPATMIRDKENQLMLLRRQLNRRKMPGRRERIIERMQLCEAAILALKLAHS